MGVKIKLISMVIGIVFFIIVSISIKKNNFRPSYSVLWLLVAFFLISIPVFEPVYRWFTYSVIGLDDARHIIYIALIGFLLMYIFYITAKISQMSDKIQQLISHTAILELKISESKNENI